MVRWLAVVLALAVGACSGRSEKPDEKIGDAGEGGGGTNANGGTNTNGGTNANGGSSTGGSANGGAATGGSESGGAETGGSESGGAETGGSQAGGSETGGSENGGEANASSGGSSQGGASGSAGAGGEPGECSEPNPAGCPQTACSESERCEVLMGSNCRPSSCTCSEGQWVCTRDCGGGVCRPASCPMGCEPGEGTCGTDGVTWVCYPPMFGGSELVEAGCQDLGTQIPRFCCPATYKPECRFSR